ncbi:MAG: hypothetical protein K8H88_27710, partial [Sandaracinaceae bacterium]|nr:hypothetical protein [Sandaracinaceae bacterium]
VRTEVALLSDLQRFSAVWTGSLGYRRTVIGYQRVRPFSDRAGNGCPWSRRATDDAPRDLSPEERELWAQRRAGSDVQYPPGSQLSEIREHGPIPTGVDIGLDLGLGVWAGPTSRPVATVVAVVEVPLYFHIIGVEVGVGVGLGALFGTLAQEAVPAQSPAYFLARATAFVSVFEMLRLDVGLPLLTDGNASHTGLTLTLGISFGRSAYPRLVDDPSWP